MLLQYLQMDHEHNIFGQFVFYSAHVAISLVAEYQLWQLLPQMFVYKQS